MSVGKLQLLPPPTTVLTQDAAADNTVCMCVCVETNKRSAHYSNSVQRLEQGTSHATDRTSSFLRQRSHDNNRKSDQRPQASTEREVLPPGQYNDIDNCRLGLVNLSEIFIQKILDSDSELRKLERKQTHCAMHYLAV